ncbi:MAG: gp436 family protein [Candidatus Gastranaerophilaceae bacterium]
MYCTLEDLKNRITEKTLINLTQDVLPATAINTETAEDNIKIADDLINSALRNKYTLPLKSVPDLIRQISADITIYRLYCRRPQKVPDNYVKNYEVALQILKELQSGSKRLDLPSSAGESAAAESVKLYVTDKTDEDRMFSDDVLKGMLI